MPRANCYIVAGNVYHLTHRCHDRQFLLPEFRAHLNAALAEAILNDELERQAKWTQAIAVGDRAFIEAMENRIRPRQELTIEEEGGSWVLREEYGTLFGPEKRAIGSF